VKDDDINVEMIWAGKESWVCFLLVLLGVFTAFDFRDSLFHTDWRRKYTGVKGRYGVKPFEHWRRTFAGNRGWASLIHVVDNIG